MLKKIKKNSEINLHLGCGKVYIPGFIHIDINKFKHIDYVSKAENLKMFKNNTVDLIYACHLLEYYSRDETQKLLKEWKRVLKKGGKLRIAVPNFENIVKVYNKYKNIDARGILGPIYGRWKVKGQKNDVFHKTAYDFSSLKKVLLKNGFYRVKKYDSLKTEYADIDDYSQAFIPHMKKKSGILISLNVECQKK